jgi:hypothetical protein
VKVVGFDAGDTQIRQLKDGLARPSSLSGPIRSASMGWM